MKNRTLFSLGSAVAGVSIMVLLLNRLFSEWTAEDLQRLIKGILVVSFFSTIVVYEQFIERGYRRSQAGKNALQYIVVPAGGTALLLTLVVGYRASAGTASFGQILHILLWGGMVLLLLAVIAGIVKTIFFPPPLIINARPNTQKVWRWSRQKLPAQTCLHCGHSVSTSSQFCNSCGTILVQQPGMPVVRHFDKSYLCEREIGCGADGRVFRAQGPEGTVAVKELLLDPREPLAEQTAAILRFFAEADQLKVYRHPAIPQLIASVEQDGRYFTILEYIEGLPLDVLVKNMRHLNETFTLKIARELVGVLEYLHERKRVFLDLKPANIIVDRSMGIKVVDFGITTAQLSVAVKELARGTNGYFSPQQAAGQITPECDYYALGAVLFFCLTGKDPGDFPLFSQLPDPRLAKPSDTKISDAMANAIIQLTQLKVTDRPRTMDQVKALLRI